MKKVKQNISSCKANKYTMEQKKRKEIKESYAIKNNHERTRHSIPNKTFDKKTMNILCDKKLSPLCSSNLHQSYIDEELNNDNKTTNSLFHRFKGCSDLFQQWRSQLISPVSI